jgi:hypothetical protein
MDAPIIPGWKRENGWVEISYYQRFLEIRLHELEENNFFLFFLDFS